MADVTVGRSIPLQPGQQPASQSLSVVTASDIPPLATYNAYGGTGELDRDLLGNPRYGTPQLLLGDVRRYDINPKVWASRVDSNSQGRIVFDPNKSAARLAIQNGNFARTYASLQTKINFPYQAGRAMNTSYGVQFSRGSANENVVIEFGSYDNNDGYGFRILYEDGKDKLLIFRRTSSGETSGLVQRDSIPYLAGHSELMGENAYEQIIEIGNSTASGYTVATNGNRLDGSSTGAVDVNGNPTTTGHKLSLFDGSLTASHLTMFKIEYSWYGASGAAFSAFVPLDKAPQPNIPRWVKIQTIPIGGNLQFPSLKNPDKPLTFRIYRRADKTLSTNVPSANAFLSTFGTSVSIEAGDPKPMEIFPATSGLVTLTNSLSNPVLGLRIKPTIKSSTNTTTGLSVDTPNQLRAYPLNLSISSTAPCSFTLLKNPTVTGNVFPTPVAGDLSAISTATTLGTVTANTGKSCGTFYTGVGDGQTIDLTDIFAYNREFLGREAQADISTAGDSLYVMVQGLTPTATINTLTSSGTTATATVNAGHPYKTGDYVTVTGATQTGYNLTAIVTVLSATQFTYTVASGLVTPATGTITSDLNVNVSASLIWGQQ
ncbi:MAG: hypothetical protein ACO312_06155 [Candidatus Nanopelagicaceae bacterium]